MTEEVQDLQRKAQEAKALVVSAEATIALIEIEPGMLS